MMGSSRLYLAMLVALHLVALGSTGAISNETYAIRSSGVGLPEGVELGRYQRTLRPFENWTLICDEDLDKADMICNFTQTLEDAQGKLVFSWSLAATSEGAPYMIVRTAAEADASKTIGFKFSGRENPVQIQIDGCNTSVCVAMLPVGPIMRGQIGNQGSPLVRYSLQNGEAIEVQPTLAGLSDGLAALGLGPKRQ